MTVKELMKECRQIIDDWTKLSDDEREEWYCGTGMFGFIDQYSTLDAALDEIGHDNDLGGLLYDMICDRMDASINEND